MDDATYEQIELQKDWVGEERIPYLQEGMKTSTRALGSRFCRAKPAMP